MVVGEFRKDNICVTIHDDCYEKDKSLRIKRIEKIISDSYLRRAKSANYNKAS